jgi:hypothetical protein
MRRWFFQILFVLHLEVVVTLGLEKVIISKPIYFIGITSYLINKPNILRAIDFSQTQNLDTKFHPPIDL